MGLASKLPFGDSGFFGQARAGFHKWDVEFEVAGSFVNIPGVTQTLSAASNDGTDPYYGVALGYDFTSQFGVSLNLDQYDTDDGEIDRFSVGGEFRF